MTIILNNHIRPSLTTIHIRLSNMLAKEYSLGMYCHAEVEKVVNPVNLVDRKYSQTQSFAENISKILK